MATGDVEIPHGSLSEEEKNCIRFYILTTKLGTKAVRMIFDKVIPPTTLHQHLANHTVQLHSLNNKKVLNKQQIDTLYPAEQQELVIQTWKRDEEEHFVNTRASTVIYNTCLQKKCVTITGNSGAGKSANAYHVALQLQSCGYTVIPVNTVEEICMYGDVSQKQVFVIDDPVGKECLDLYKLSNVETYNRNLQTLLESDIKVICTCRKQVANDKRFQISKFIFADNIINLHDISIELTHSEKIKMLRKHTSKCQIRLTPQLIDSIADKHYTNFPLLCKLFGGNASYQEKGEAFFANMFLHLKEELISLKHNQKLKFCSLVLCMISDNDFDTKSLDIFSSNTQDKEKTLKVVEACGLPTNTSRKELVDEMERLTDVYLIKEGTRYRFIHDSLYETTACLFGQEFPHEVINTCSSRFIREHVRVSDSNEDTYVVIQPCHYIGLSKRFSEEIQKGNFHDVFLNPSMYETSFLDIFIQYLRELPEPDLRRMMLDVAPNINTYMDYFRLTFPKECHSRDWYKHTVLEDNKVKAIHWLLAYNIESLTELCLNHFKAVQIRENGLVLVPMACLGGNEEIVRRLLNENKSGMNDVWDSKWDRGISTLHMAVLSGNYNMVKRIIENGVDVNIETLDGRTPLYLAAILGLTDICKYLVIERQADVNICMNRGISPLYNAAQKGHTKIVQLLIQHNANVNQCWTEHDYSPLFRSSFDGHTDVVKILLDKGADVNMINKKGDTPLYSASRNGHTETARLLLENQADVRVKTSAGLSPLLHAAINGHANIVQLLLQHNANVNDCWRGCTPLYWSSFNGHVDVVKSLLEWSANVNISSSGGLTPLYAASQEGHDSIVALLIQHKANVNQCWTETWQSPLWAAASNGHIRVVSNLVNQGANVNFSDSNNYTPLTIAAAKGHIDIVKLLLEHNAALNIMTASGRSAIDEARFHGFNNIANLIMSLKGLLSICGGAGFTVKTDR